MSAAHAEDYPTRPIRLIVPFAPGGGNDTVARLVGESLGKRLGQPVVVDNRPGAGGVVGAEAAAKAPADGYTLFLGGVGSHAINPNLHKDLPYDPIKDFAAVAILPQVRAGKLRALAVTARKRMALLPDVPTIAESGVPNYETSSWYGILAPAGTRPEIVHRLHDEIVKVLAQDDVRKALAQEGAEPVGNSSEEFAEFIRAEKERLGAVIESGKVSLQ